MDFFGRQDLEVQVFCVHYTAKEIIDYQESERKFSIFFKWGMIYLTYIKDMVIVAPYGGLFNEYDTKLRL